MSTPHHILCIGSLLWDIIGRSTSHMERGSDVPGRITRIPGGVALNIAMAVRQLGLEATVLSAVGGDAEGAELLAAIARRGIVTDHVYTSPDMPTDRYMAIEGANGVIAAIADAHTLEAAGDKILAPLLDGRLARADAPWRGVVALDGNLSVDLLQGIARGPALAAADLRIAPASPGKAQRLAVFVERGGATIYLNREEAGLIAHTDFATAAEAAEALRARGASRVIVTDGAKAAADASEAGIITRTPPQVMVTRVTGAGDVFMAAHIAAELRGADREAAFAAAQRTAADYISGETAL